jgi:hypothetical protein
MGDGDVLFYSLKVVLFIYIFSKEICAARGTGGCLDTTTLPQDCDTAMAQPSHEVRNYNRGVDCSPTKAIPKVFTSPEVDNSGCVDNDD